MTEKVVSVVSLDEESPERSSAQVRFRQAQQEASRRRFGRAEELAREALEIDESFVEVRLWLADLYEQLEEPRKAGRLYQDILHADRDNQAAWEALERVDPAAAKRLRRLSEIPPDPFVARRAQGAELSDDLTGMETLSADDLADVGVADFGLAHEVSEEIAGDLEEVTDDLRPAVQPSVTAGEAFDEVGGEEADEEGEVTRGPADWEYEQDRPMLAKWQAEPTVQRMAAAIRAAWEEEVDVLDPVYNLCAHGERHSHASIFEAVNKTSETLAIKAVEIYIVPERSMDTIAFRDQPPAIAVPTGVLRGMEPQEQLFQVARGIFYITAGYLPEWQAADIILDRKTRMLGDCASVLRETLAEQVGRWRDQLSGADVERLQKLAHAWQQRVTLSADRAGLITCRDIDVACLSIAKATAKSAEAAAAMTVGSFLEQFAGQDAAALAAIPPEASPDRSDSYAAYRIHMLRWWASTPQGQQLLAL